MKRVNFGCDPVGACLVWEEGGFISASGTLPITISYELRQSLFDWNERMGVLVRTPERYSQSDLLTAREELNEEGEQLARRIEAEHDGRLTVHYRAE